MYKTILLWLITVLRRAVSNRGAIFGSILLCALVAFEFFNFSTTDFALADLLGNLRFAGVAWSTILAFAFCGIDFAGIARIFTPQTGRDEPTEVWYLFGAWLLAAGFNAALTWWGISVAIINHTAEGSVLIGRELLIRAVPVFVAAMVWLMRVLIIGTFSIAGENLFSMADARPATYQPMRPMPAPRPSAPAVTSYVRPAPKPAASYETSRPLYPEPTYHPVGMSAEARSENHPVRQ
jgi:hypothetical protein